MPLALHSVSETLQPFVVYRLWLALLSAGSAAGSDLVIEKASDFTCTGGAAFILKGPEGAPLPNIRSGNPSTETECMFVTPPLPPSPGWSWTFGTWLGIV
eukprot:SAG11_NODE_18893_length_479_cov_0.542105_1_plen_99_part_01